MYSGTITSWEDYQKNKEILLPLLSDLVGYWDKAELFIALIRENRMSEGQMETFLTLIEEAINTVKDKNAQNAFIAIKDHILVLRMQEQKEKEAESINIENILWDSL